MPPFFRKPRSSRPFHGKTEKRFKLNAASPVRSQQRGEARQCLRLGVANSVGLEMKRKRRLAR